MDEQLLKAYLGNNYNSIKTELISIKALIFGPIYLLYKNMTIKGLLYLITIILLYYCNKEVSILINIIINIYLCFRFNSLYLNFCIEKVEEIKLTHSNLNKKELIELCRKKSNSKRNVIIIILILICIFIEIIINKPTNKSIDIEDTIYLISYKIDKSFTKGKQNTSNYKHYYYIDDNNNCKITITVDKERQELSKAKQINNNLWSIETNIVDNKEINTYQIEIDNNIYHIRYEIEKGNQCKKLEKEFLNSIQLKTQKNN